MRDIRTADLADEVRISAYHELVSGAGAATAEVPQAQDAPEPPPNLATAREVVGSSFQKRPCRCEHRLFGLVDGKVASTTNGASSSS
jgi:hypothetical protein